MGFLDVLGKVINGTGNFMAESKNTIANQIDRMSDEEIKRKYPNSSVDEKRKQAESWHLNYRRWKEKAEKHDKAN